MGTSRTRTGIPRFPACVTFPPSSLQDRSKPSRHTPRQRRAHRAGREPAPFRRPVSGPGSPPAIRRQIPLGISLANAGNKTPPGVIRGRSRCLGRSGCPTSGREIRTWGYRSRRLTGEARGRTGTAPGAGPGLLVPSRWDSASWSWSCASNHRRAWRRPRTIRLWFLESSENFAANAASRRTASSAWTQRRATVSCQVASSAQSTAPRTCSAVVSNCGIVVSPGDSSRPISVQPRMTPSAPRAARRSITPR